MKDIGKVGDQVGIGIIYIQKKVFFIIIIIIYFILETKSLKGLVDGNISVIFIYKRKCFLLILLFFILF